MKTRILRRRAAAADRARVVWRWLSGESAKEISLESNTSISTIYRWVQQWKLDGTLGRRSYPRYSRRNQRDHNATTASSTQQQIATTGIDISRSLQLYYKPQILDHYLQGSVIKNIMYFHTKTE
ncbi:putative homeodomain-like HTH_23 containing protein 2 [Homarus americanus]|uniref:Putative homeodomain-like HTH_23 containing protein 2 n=1 Tax=Homarus americanus TaxID=6706 RepID=A0A8J5JJ48_HOMAM|nr:putative homeodomain-like HTH_23 containing protein 2 [Homarus americanus]